MVEVRSDKHGDRRIGILLAGGSGTRLSPLTLGASKHLLAVYDKPMIYYSLCSLMMSGTREIIVVLSPKDLAVYQSLLGDGQVLGLNIQYALQERPRGIADAILAAEKQAGNRAVVVALGDNFFHGWEVSEATAIANADQSVATLFAFQVDDPSRYGVISFAEDGRTVLDIREKPLESESNWAVPGLYFYDADVFDMARTLHLSPRGELEVSDLNRLYLAQGRLKVISLPPHAHWSDLGCPDELQAASNFVSRLQKTTEQYIGCPEEIAFRSGWLTRQQLVERASSMPNRYGKYLLTVANR